MKESFSYIILFSVDINHGKLSSELFSWAFIDRFEPNIDFDREDGGRVHRWRYPGDKKVTFASRLPKLHAETPVEEWLHGEFKVIAAIVVMFIRTLPSLSANSSRQVPHDTRFFSIKLDKGPVCVPDYILHAV